MICRICKDEMEANTEDLCVYCYDDLERQRLQSEEKKTMTQEEITRQTKIVNESRKEMDAQYKQFSLNWTAKYWRNLEKAMLDYQNEKQILFEMRHEAKEDLRSVNIEQVEYDSEKLSAKTTADEKAKQGFTENEIFLFLESHFELKISDSKELARRAYEFYH